MFSVKNIYINYLNQLFISSLYFNDESFPSPPDLFYKLPALLYKFYTHLNRVLQQNLPQVRYVIYRLPPDK